MSNTIGYFNPHAEEYKRVILNHSVNTTRFRNDFHLDIHNDNSLICPPHLFDTYIRSTGNQAKSEPISSLEDPDPSNYPEYISIRINGNVPTAVQYANELTDFDPRCYKVANSLLLSPTHITDDEAKQQISSRSYTALFGNLAPLDTILDMGDTSVLNLEYTGGRYFIGLPKLIDLGKEYEDTVESGVVKYGGSFFIPTENRPHGLFELDSIYFYMDQYTEEVSNWVEEQLFSSVDDQKLPDEFDTVKSTDEMNPHNTCYIRAWWD